MAAYVAAQWQATSSKNQLVLGPPGQHAVISAEDFGQVSTIKIPDPGSATSSFVLKDVKGGSQTINGNLTVTGSQTVDGDLTVVGKINNSGGTTGNLLLNGDLVFSNTADRKIRFDAAKTATFADGANLSIIGNDSGVDGNDGGKVSIVGGIGGDNGGNVEINGGFGEALGGNILIKGGESTDSSAAGDVTISSSSGNVTLQSTSGTVEVKTTAGGEINIEAGQGVTNGPKVTITAGVGGSATGGALFLQGGDATIGANGGPVNITSGDSKQGRSGTIFLDVGESKAGSSHGSIKIGTGDLSGNLPEDVTIGSTTQDRLGNTIYANLKPVVVAAAGQSPKTLVLGNSGSVVFVTGPAAYQINLPVPTAGQFFKIMNAVLRTNPLIVKTNGTANVIRGFVLTNPGGPAFFDNGGVATSQFTFDTGCQPGDFAELNSDGTFWYLYGVSTSNPGMSLP